MATPLAEITNIIRELLREPDLEVRPAARFDDLPGWDSMDLISVVVEVECRFDLQFELSEIDRLTTIDDLLHMIVTKRALSAA